MQIRRAEFTDEDELARIRRSAILGVESAAFPLADVQRWADGVAADRIAGAIREHEVWVAVEKEAIGWVEIDGDRVAGLYVDAPLARRGIGSQLLAHAEAEIRAAGHANARLEASENALAFYLHRSYVHSGAQLPDSSWPMTKSLLGGDSG